MGEPRGRRRYDFKEGVVRLVLEGRHSSLNYRTPMEYNREAIQT